VDAPNGLSDQNGDVDRLDLVALQLLDLVWNGIGDNDLFVDGNMEYNHHFTKVREGYWTSRPTSSMGDSSS